MFVIQVDAKAAFDSIKHEALFDLLMELKCPYWLVHATIKCYEHRKVHAVVHQPSGAEVDAEIAMANGVNQGLSESGWMFSAALAEKLKKAMESWKEWCFGAPFCFEDEVTHVAFVDDFLLTSSTWEGAKTMLAEMQQAMFEIGLDVNQEKTKLVSNVQGFEGQWFEYLVSFGDLLVVGTKDIDDTTLIDVVVGTPVSLKLANVFETKITFFGIDLEMIQCFTSMAVEKRIRVGWIPFWANTPIYFNKHIELKERIRFWFKTTLVSMTWGCEVCDLVQSCVRRVDQVVIEMVMKMMQSKRQKDEPWVEWHVRAFRFARSVFWPWSEQWVSQCHQKILSLARTFGQDAASL